MDFYILMHTNQVRICLAALLRNESLHNETIQLLNSKLSLKMGPTLESNEPN